MIKDFHIQDWSDFRVSTDPDTSRGMIPHFEVRYTLDMFFSSRQVHHNLV